MEYDCHKYPVVSTKLDCVINCLTRFLSWIAGPQLQQPLLPGELEGASMVAIFFIGLFPLCERGGPGTSRPTWMLGTLTLWTGGVEENPSLSVSLPAPRVMAAMATTRDSIDRMKNLEYYRCESCTYRHCRRTRQTETLNACLTLYR